MLRPRNSIRNRASAERRPSHQGRCRKLRPVPSFRPCSRAGLMALQRLESVDGRRKLDERRTLTRTNSSFRGNEENYDSNLARPELLAVPHKPQCVPRSSEEGESMQAVPVEYMPTEDLQPVEDAQSCLNTISQRLSSKNWSVVCHALVNVRQLSIFHRLAFRPQLESVIPSILRSMQSPRSVLCKTAIMVTADLLAAYADGMLDYIDQILPHLLMKASQDKQFVCEEAARTLQSMTTALSPGPLLMKLQHLVQHRNPRVRAKATVALQQTAAKLGADGLAKWGLDALVKIAASKNLQEHASVDDSTLDGSLNSTAQNWEQLCRRVLPVTAAVALIDLTCTTSIQEPATSAVSVLGVDA
eukprot:SM000021S06421  [mRNA]  locus=s21:120546:122770:- [translate_table: standard]